MNRTIYFGWLFVIMLFFLSTIVQFIKRGPSLRVGIGLVIGLSALLLLKYLKKK